jgi:tetratricopeptide (TPR) repeat protein
MAGRYNESKKYFEKYLELTKGNIPAKIRYVNALFYAKEYSEVIKNVEEIFAVDRSRTYMNRIAGYSAYEMGNYDLALKYMDKLFESLDKDRLIKKDYIYYARILTKKNQNFSKLVIETDNDEGDLTTMEGKYAALKTGPDKVKIKADIDALKAKVTDSKAKIANAEVELKKASEAYEKAAFFGDEDLNLLYEKGSAQYAARKYSDAAATWSRLLEKGRDTENDFIQVGRAYYQAKDFDKADAIFNKMVAKYPNDLQGYLWIANTASAKDPDSELGLAKPKFITLLKKASADSVKNVSEMFDAIRYLGYDALQNKRYDEARSYYNRMTNLAPNNNEYKIKAYSSLSTMYITMGDYTRAIEENNRILAIDPTNESAKSTIQYIQAAQKNAVPKANPNEITGVISDASGNPIPGASVRVKDTAAEAWTNVKGEYKFVMPEASEKLVIGAKGYKTIEVTITKKRVYNATLEK